MSQVLTADDPRYKELFDASKEARELGNEISIDVNPLLNALRDRGSVLKGGLRELLHLPERPGAWDKQHDAWTLTTFNVCNRALRENLVFSSHIYHDSPPVRTLGDTILWMTGDEHKRYRAAVQPMFIKPRAINWWKKNWIDAIVASLVGRLEGMDRADLNFDLCARLPVHTVTRGIGMEGDKALTFRDHLLKAVGVRKVGLAEQAAAHAEVERMLRELITERRIQPGDDLVSGLIAADFELADGGTSRLSDEQIMGYCRLIMLAGGGTTWRQLGITLHALLSNYSLWEACRENRELIEDAIEESARWIPTDPVFPRLVTEEVEVDGQLLPKGVRVDVCMGSANRDPSRWENPDVYDPFREKKSHLGFAVGPHQCLGMNVAKQEMLSALNALMDHFPNLRLDPEAPAPILVGGLEQRGMSAVPVRFR
jgi:cytochrome P450